MSANEKWNKQWGKCPLCRSEQSQSSKRTLNYECGSSFFNEAEYDQSELCKERELRQKAEGEVSDMKSRKRYFVNERTGEVVIGAIGYNVSRQDGQIIFEESTPIFGCHTVFAFEKKGDINGSTGIWYLVHLDASSERVASNHLYGAIEYCNDVYGKSFEGNPT